MVRSVTILSVTALLLAHPVAFAEDGKQATSRPSQDASRQQFPVPVALADVRVGGELRQRLDASFNRLEEELYHVPKLYDEPNEGWPGDKEGRTLLGLVLLSKVTGREPKYLDDIINEYPKRVNARGYLGTLLTPEAISEQTLGGQFWLVRAFYEYAAWKKEERALTWADQLIKNVYFPAAGAFRHYPIEPASRKSQDLVFGKEAGQSGKWVLSSDTGCGLSGALDALTCAYSTQPSKELETLLEEVIKRYLEMDLEAVRAQTHFTLTATRALLRHYETTGRKALLKAAIKRYHLYRDRAMTDAFQNHNWFGRPEWTESCAVVDSFIVAVQLWRLTGEAQYLEDAHLIYYNGICASQRSNGGFGCNSCPSTSDPFLFIKTQEAYWCCTQRGAEGLSRAAQFCFFTDESGVFVPFYHEAESALRWKEHTMKIRVKTDYPWNGKSRIEITSVEGNKPVSLRLFVPSWAEVPQVAINGKAENANREHGFIRIERPWRTGDAVDLVFTLRVRSMPPVNRVNGAENDEYHTFHYGPMILGCVQSERVRLDRSAKIRRQGERNFGVESRTVTLQPIYPLLDPATSKENGYRRQILFQAPEKLQERN